MKRLLSNKDIELICELLGERAVEESNKGNLKREKRIFNLISALRFLLNRN